MRIGFDSKRLYCNFTGLGNYSRTLVQNLKKFYPENEYHLYTPKLQKNSKTAFFHDNQNYHTHISNALIKSYWRSFSIVKDLQKDKIELFHGLSHEIPLNMGKSNIKSIVTIHDLIFKTNPDTFPYFDRKIYDLKFHHSCLNSDRIIAISHNTKRDIIRFYNIDPDKIDVIYQSCNPLFYQPIKGEGRDEIQERYGIPSDFLLYVGSIEKRKNLKKIIESYQFLSSDYKIPLVVVGNGKKYKKETQTLIRSRGIEDKIIWITNLKDNRHLHLIYKKAQALIYPSSYEGFGLPVVEALLSKTPVITSNLSSLPEAGGPSSCYVDPNSPEQIADAITEILSDSELRDSMKINGYEYALRNFSSDHVTRQVFQCYYKTLLNNN